MDAGFGLRRIKDKLGLAAFLLHRVVAGDGDLPEGLAIGGHAVAEADVVYGVGEQSYAQRGRKRNDD